MQSLYLCNNHVVITNCPTKEQLKRLESRGYNKKKIAAKLRCQFSYEKKLQIIQEQIQEDGFGSVFKVESDEDYHQTIEAVSKLYPALVY